MTARMNILSVVALLAACGGSAARPVDLVTNAPPSAANRRSVPPAAPETQSNIRVAQNIKEACGLTDTEAFFEYDSAHFKPAHKHILKKIAECFTDGPLRDRHIKLVGHADPRGDADYNYVLGQRRADNVLLAMADAGMPKEKSGTSSRGASEAEGTDELTWAKDRRVDILLGD